jgi:hypothetical protein
MKVMLLVLISFITLESFSQIVTKDEFNRRVEALMKKYPGKMKAAPNSFKTYPDQTMPINRFNTIKPGVYKLRQDNMPCIIPDTKDIVAIPNAFANVTIPFKTQMPNGAPHTFPYILYETSKNKRK